MAYNDGPYVGTGGGGGGTTAAADLTGMTEDQVAVGETGGGGLEGDSNFTYASAGPTVTVGVIDIAGDGTPSILATPTSGQFIVGTDAAYEFRIHTNNTYGLGVDTSQNVTCRASLLLPVSGGAVVVYGGTNSGVGLAETSSAPGAVANRCYIYTKDDGSGVTQLRGRFGTNDRLLFNDCAEIETVTSGALSVYTPSTAISVTGTQAYTLADGVDGQIKNLICTVAASTPAGTLTPTNSSSDYSTILFNAVGESATLIFANSAWHVLSARGATVS